MEESKSLDVLTPIDVELKETKGQKSVRMWQLAFFLLLIVAVAACVTLGLLYFYKEPDDGLKEATPPTPTEQYQYAEAAVASDAGPCSEIGRDALTKGGSAVDAAIAALLCVGLHNAQSAGIGGGFFMVTYDAQTQAVDMLDAREVAPLAAHRDMYADEAPDASVKGGLAIAVPGEVDGYWVAHQRYGRLDWSELFQPSIRLAEEGFIVSEALAKAIYVRSDDILEDPNLREIFVNSTGDLLREGDMMTRPKLAVTYRRLAQDGATTFYSGDLADDIVADIADYDGIITKKDLSSYNVRRRIPVSIQLGDLRVHSAPPPSSGAVYALIMNILQGYDLNEDSMGTVEAQTLTVHRTVEAFKFAYAGRSFLGDEDYVDVKELVANMTSNLYADQLRANINDSRTHNPSYYRAFYNQPDSGTSHTSVVDGNGNAVAVTSTVNTYFGSKARGNRTGIIFNNEMDDFSKPNASNFFNIPPSPSNYIEPGKRPMSSMTPVIAVDKNNDVRLVVGASGGSRITTGVAQVSADVLWFGDSIKYAIQRERFHHQLVPNNVTYEPGFPQAVVDGLIEKGHSTIETTSGCVVQGILRDNQELLNAYCDDRKGGYPAGI